MILSDNRHFPPILQTRKDHPQSTPQRIKVAPIQAWTQFTAKIPKLADRIVVLPKCEVFEKMPKPPPLLSLYSYVTYEISASNPDNNVI
jgi:hypothetical protein